MATRRRKRGRKKGGDARRQAAALGIAAAALVLGAALLPSAGDGTMPRALAAAQRWLVGRGAPGIPALLFLASIGVWTLDGRPRPGRRTAGLLLTYLSIVLALRWTAPAAAAPAAAGGLLGAAASDALRTLLGVWGMRLATAALGLTGAGLAAGVPGSAAVSVLAHVVAAVRAAVRTLARLLLALGRAAAGAAASAARAVRAEAGHTRRRLAGWARAWRDAREARRARAQVAGAGSAAGGDGETPRPFPQALQAPEVPQPAPAVAAAAPVPEAVASSGASPPEPAAAGEPPAPKKRARRAGEARPEPKQEALSIDEPPTWQVPPLSLLSDPALGRRGGRIDPGEVARQLERTLASFAVEAKVLRWEQGPVVTRYELQPAAGVKVQRITSLTNDIALSLAAQTVRIEAPIPGKAAVGIEIPNDKASLVSLREILESAPWQTSASPLAVGLGKDIAGQPVVADLVEMPHLLIAGATGSGKSVSINAIIGSLLFRATPVDARLLLIDPKRVELTGYNGVPHLLAPVVTTPKEAALKLKWAIGVMERRFELFSHAGARNIQAYNRLDPERRRAAMERAIEGAAERGLALEPRDFVVGRPSPASDLSLIVIIIDELADLMMVAPADFEEVICRLAQMTRATGIHLVVATQRPSVDVITGLIKANIPSRIAFAVTSQVDSRTIIDGPGADKLLGKGDMLFLPIGATRATRVQGSFVSDAEIERLVAFWKAQGEPSFNPELLAVDPSAASGAGDQDELLEQAARLVVQSGYGSVSLLQRKMKIGYVRAARVVDQLEQRGVVGPSQGSSPREVLVGADDLERLFSRGRASAIIGERDDEPE